MLSTCLLSVLKKRVSQKESLLSRFRCGCHGLHVDIGRWVDTKREDRLCQICHSSRDVEDEQHFLFSCAAYSDVRQKYANLFQQAFSVSDSFTNSELNACGGLLSECFLRIYCIHLTYRLVLFYVLYSVCWPPVGPQDMKT